ncbi:iron-containing alcohol dehydrogenase [Caulobacter sp. KR2-114]|uniref:iron-containing alcohol dehydrogenase n=1 Tax=Caulobacter sp. KR2-114 TaxID=3400912 RepID=UPI003BFCA076
MLSGTHRNSLQEQVVYGRPALEVVRELAAAWDARRVMITTTASLDGVDGLATGLKAGLGELCVGLFSAVAAHSPRTAVIAGAAEARRLEADLLLAIGGGSVIDATKVMQLALWAGLEAPEQLDDYRAGSAKAQALQPGVRMLAVPTTLSAAEFTPFAGVTDTARRAKEGFAHPRLAPRAVVLDPELTVETPPRLWFSTGMKAVDHAVEQLCNPVRTPYADALATDGLKRLAAGLAATHAHPADLDARLECQIGMWLAMSGAGAGRGLGASHAIGHVLGGTYGVPHGLTSCVALPAVLKWNEGVADHRQALVAGLLGQPGRSASAAVEGLARRLGLPTRLSEVGVGPDAFQAIAEATLHDRGVRSNPRPITSAEDVVEILQLAR